jgi:hypothetical protein
MPSKSRRKRRSIPQNKPATQTVVGPASVSVPANSRPSRPTYPSQSESSKPPAPLTYPYIKGELARIGIVAGLIIVILVILALFLR